MSYARRTDSTHTEVIKTLRQCGWKVADTSRLPKFVDAVAYHPGRDSLRLVEIKSAKGKMTDAQDLFMALGFPVHVLRSVDDALALK